MSIEEKIDSIQNDILFIKNFFLPTLHNNNHKNKLIIENEKIKFLLHHKKKIRNAKSKQQPIK